MLWDVVGVEPPCVRRWAGRTVVRGFTAPSVVNSVKVRFNIEHLSVEVMLMHKLESRFRVSFIILSATLLLTIVVLQLAPSWRSAGKLDAMMEIKTSSWSVLY